MTVQKEYWTQSEAISQGSEMLLSKKIVTRSEHICSERFFLQISRYTVCIVARRERRLIKGGSS